MSTTLFEGDGLQVTAFAGGMNRGQCVSLYVRDFGAVELNANQVGHLRRMLNSLTMDGAQPLPADFRANASARAAAGLLAAFKRWPDDNDLHGIAGRAVRLADALADRLRDPC